MSESKCIELVQGPYGVWRERKKPYITIEGATKDDYEHMQQLLATGRRMRWRRPEDELPPEDENVLVIVNGKWSNYEFCDAVVVAAFYGDEGWVLEQCPEWETPDIAWWMPLPLLPGEVE